MLEPEEPGSYKVEIDIMGKDGSVGEASFDLDISSSGTNWLFIIALVVASATVLLLLFGRNRSKTIAE